MEYKKILLMSVFAMLLFGCDSSDSENSSDSLNNVATSTHCSVNNQYYIIDGGIGYYTYIFTLNECSDLTQAHIHNSSGNILNLTFITEDGEYYSDPHYDLVSIDFTSTDGTIKKHYDGDITENFIPVTETIYDEGVEVDGDFYYISEDDAEYLIIYKMASESEYDELFDEAIMYATEIAPPITD